jgi:GLPGLI family protein
MGKKFLIQDTLNAPAWKITDETKTIKGLLCRKATLENKNNSKTTQNITAWYAENMPVSIGPDGFHSLPGAILEVNINAGERIITALSITYRLLKENELKIPSGGKKVTEAEFKNIVDDFMKQNSDRMKIIRN